MVKYKHFVTVKNDDNYYGIVAIVTQKEIESFYTMLKKLESNCTTGLLSLFASKYGDGAWGKIKSAKAIQKIAKLNNCDIICNVVTKEKTISKM
jgi:hypothetical protein